MHISRRTSLSLGGLGLIPFAGLALGALMSAHHASLFVDALIYYGATILAFLGGIHWGIALQRTEPAPTHLYITGVLPQLWGFGALLTAPALSLILLAAGLLAIFVADIAYAGMNLLPRWFLNLRFILTIGATASLGAALWTIT